MISNGKELFNLIDTIFKPLGYIKKKETWYLHTPECICFFTIEKSFYSGKYGHAFGCFLKELNNYNNKEYPDYSKSNFRIGLDFFINKTLIENAFNLEYMDFVQNERENIIKNLIEKHVTPFLKQISTKQGIVEANVEYPKLKYHMKLVLKEWLGIIEEGDVSN